MIRDIVLKTLDDTHSIKKYVNPMSVSYLSQISSDSFETGTIILEPVRSDLLENIDLSRPIPTNSVVEIHLTNGEVIQTHVAEDLVSPILITGELWKHEVQLVEPVKLLTRINIPAVTITQPKTMGFVTGNDVFSDTVIVGDDKIFTGKENRALMFRGGDSSHVDFNIHHDGNELRSNLTRGEGLVFTKNETKKLGFSSTPTINADGDQKEVKLQLTLVNPQFNLQHKQTSKGAFSTHTRHIRFRNAAVPVTVQVFVNGSVYKTYPVMIPAGEILNPLPVHVNFWGNWTEWKSGSVDRGTFYTYGGFGSENLTFYNSKSTGKYPADVSPLAYDVSPGFYFLDEVFTIPGNISGEVEVKVTNELNQWEIAASVSGWNKGNYINTSRHTRFLLDSGSLTIYSQSDGDIKDYKPLDKEIDKILNLTDRHTITLDSSTRARIADIPAPELTYEKNNMYEVLRDIGSYIGAIPKLRLNIREFTYWIPSTEAEYNAGQTKIQVPELDILSYLNHYHKNDPVGTVANTIAPNAGYIFKESSETEFNNATYQLEVEGETGPNPTQQGLWNTLKAFDERYYNDVDLAYIYGMIFRFDTGYSYEYFKLVKTDEGYVKYAKVETTNKSTEHKEFYYKFYDDLELGEVMEPVNSQNMVKSRNSEDYVSGIELNADNLVAEDTPVNTGWLKLTGTISNDFEKLTTDNIGLRLPNGPIYQITKVLLQLGTSFKLKDGSNIITIPADKIVDITDLVIEETHYNTLVNKSEYTMAERNYEITKNQVLFYKQGHDILFNLGFTGTRLPVSQWDGTPSSNRTIYEIAAKKAVLEYNMNTEKEIIDPGTLDADRRIKILVEYIPMSSTRTTIYKDDQSGFLEHLTRYYNEQQKINDAGLLGRTAQGTINRMGNTEIERDGSTSSLSLVPKIGSLDEPKGRILTKLNRIFQPGRVDYTGTYVRDYSVINEYFGIPSAYRQYEIPKDNIVRRMEKKEVHAYIGKEPYEDTSIYGIEVKDLFKHLDITIPRVMKTPQLVEIEVYDDKQAQNVRMIKSLSTHHLGKGITHTFEMDDNYSAGKQIVPREEDGQTQYYQQDIEYTDAFGNASRLKAILYNTNDLETSTSSLVTNITGYPILPVNFNRNTYNLSISSEYDYRMDKDTREAIGFTQDIKYFSGNNDIHVFEGLAKYSLYGKVDEVSLDIKLLHRPISRSTVKLNNRDLITPSAKSLTFIGDNQINYSVSTNSIGRDFPGFVIYEKNTMEPLLAVYDPIQSGIGSTTSGSLYLGIDTFDRETKIPELPVTKSPKVQGVFSDQASSNEWGIYYRIKNEDSNEIELTINGISGYTLSGGDEKWFFMRTEYFNKEGQTESIELTAQAEGKLPITSNYNVVIKDYWGGSTTPTYSVTFKRGWNNTIIKTEVIEEGSSATWPTDMQINYGIDYEYDYHTGEYIDVISDRTVTIYRKKKYVAPPVTPVWSQARFLSVDNVPPGEEVTPHPEGNPPTGGICPLIGERRYYGVTPQGFYVYKECILED